MRKYALIIPCWGGPRRTQPKWLMEDRGYYVRAQRDALLCYEHSSDVFFVINGDLHPQVAAALEDVVHDGHNVIFRPHNIGWSYGAWADVCRWFTDEYTHFVVTEDDYVPGCHHFDSKLADLMIEKDVAYLCGYYTDHAAMSGGIIDSNAARRVGGLPVPQINDYAHVQADGQEAISKAFTNKGYAVADYTDRYMMVFAHGLGRDGRPVYEVIGEGETPFVPVGWGD